MQKEKHLFLFITFMLFLNQAIVGDAKCIGTSKANCFDNVGDDCSDWETNAALCCTTNGLVYCGNHGKFAYTPCPNNAQCRTDFQTCYQNCVEGNPSWVNQNALDCENCNCNHDACNKACNICALPFNRWK